MNEILVTLVCGVVGHQYHVFRGEYFNGHRALIAQDVNNDQNKALLTTITADETLLTVRKHPVVRAMIKKKLLIPQGIATDGRYICQMNF